ncbi:MAG TPA: NADH-quinone oxidoreductase subunit H [Actinomycetales bacterium]|nr:NADH-quinone oxidoreductase subunit H [Actinomycetales bacterium]
MNQQPVMTAGTTLAAVVGLVVQTVLLLALAPVVVGMMRQVRARLEGRVGAGTGQPWRDLRKLARKEPLRPAGTTAVFRAAPWVLLGTSVVVAAVGPFLSTTSPLDQFADLFAVVSLLLLGTVAMALAGLDTGTPFGGMGASRGITITAIAEPTLLVAGFALSSRVGSSNLADMVAAGAADPGHVFSPVSLLAAIALVVVIVAETGRLPVDNPSTHLELTMIHEAMVLEHSGRDLAAVELASALRLTLLLGLLATLFLPFGVATAATAGAMALSAVLLVAKVAALAALLAAAEVALAKLRLFRVPELLAGSFLFSTLAVAAAFFLGP